MTVHWWPRYAEKMQRGKFRLLNKDVAEAAGVSYSQLNRWINGHGEPNISQAAAMVLLVETSLDEIFIPDARAKRNTLERVQDRRKRRKK